MAGFNEIVGHEQIIEHLRNAITMDKVSHAYIFNGPEYSGKMMLAEAFAMALQCEEHNPEDWRIVELWKNPLPFAATPPVRHVKEKLSEY